MTDTVDAPDRIRPPRAISLAFAAVIAYVTLSLVNSALLWGFQDYLRRKLIESNSKAKKPKNPYPLSEVNHDLHNGLNVGILQTAIFGFLMILLAVNIRRGKGWARWGAILVLVVVAQAPFRLLSLGGDAPALMRVSSALVGLAAIAVIVLVLMPESTRYFAAVRGANAAARGPGAGARAGAGAGAPSLRDLFSPRPRRTVEPDAKPTVPDDATGTAPSRARGREITARKAAQPAAKPAQTVQSGQTASGGGRPAQPPAEKRAKAKARAGVEVESPASPQQRSPSGGAPKNRGKSRKGS